MAQRCEPFEIEVHERRGDVYPVTAQFEGASWHGEIAAALPLFSQKEIEQALDWFGRGFIDRAYAQEFGARLFSTLFPPPIREGFRATYERVAADGRGLRLVLTLPPDLAPLPWELMYDAEGRHGFLARSQTTPLVRRLPEMPLSNELPAEGPLRVLVVAASPTGYTPIDGGQETDALTRSLAGARVGTGETLVAAGRDLLRNRSWRAGMLRLQDRRRVTVDLLPHASRKTLQEKMIAANAAEHPYHVIHFIGHAAADADGSWLLLEDDNGRPDIVPADEFAELAASPAVSLVLLNACQTAAALDLFNGAAQAFLRRGIPAVIGMQVPILEQTALDFAREFYAFWAAGESIEASLAYARRLMTRGANSAVADWSIPVLYMGPTEGLSLKLHAAPRSPWRRVLAVLSVLLVTVIPTAYFYLNLLPKAPARMNGVFNVAVAEFGQVQDRTAGGVSKIEDGKWLSQQVAEKLANRLAEIGDLAGDVQLRYDTVGIVSGDTPQARQAYVAQLAQEINADVVVYGNIDRGRLPAEFVPEFYISPRLTGAEEVTGPGSFGAPITITLPLAHPDNRAQLKAQVLPRLEALTEFMYGMAFYKAKELDLALQQFELARAVPQWRDAPGAGKEILYLWIGTVLIGRAHAGQAAGCPLETGAGLDNWACARLAYENALELNPGFARAHIGLGNFWADQAEKQRGGQVVVICQAYDLALEAYRQALDPKLAAEDTAQVALKTRFNIGLAYANAYRNGCSEEAYGQAKEHLTAALSLRASGPDTPLTRDIGARAAYHLGLIEARAGQHAAAVNAFAQAIQLAEPASDYEDTWQAIRWQAHLQSGYACMALARAGDAAQWRSALADFSGVVARYEARQYADGLIVGAAYTGQGLVQEALDDRAAALKSYQRALTVPGIDQQTAAEAAELAAALGGQ